MTALMGDTWSVLVVEDDESIRALISEALGTEGVRVLEAADGEEALRLATANDLSAIVLDIGLPRLDGIAVADRLRDMERTIPIVVVTAANRADGVSRIRPAALITKPFEVSDLVTAVKQLIAPPPTATEGAEVRPAES